MSAFMHVTFNQPPPPAAPGTRWKVGASRWAAATRPLVRNAIKDKAPIGQGRNAGQLKRSITQRTTSRAGSVLLEFGSPLPYVAYVVDGTRPHMIVPRNKRALAFTTDAGVKVMTRSVNHPGTRSNHFPKRAVAPLLPALQESFSTIMAEAFGGTE